MKWLRLRERRRSPPIVIIVLVALKPNLNLLTGGGVKDEASLSEVEGAAEEETAVTGLFLPLIGRPKRSSTLMCSLLASSRILEDTIEGKKARA